MPTFLLKLIANRKLLIALGIIIGLAILYFFLRKVFKKDKEESARDALESHAIEIGIEPEELLSDAKSLFIEMGYDGPFGWPLPWENEPAVIRIIRNYDRQSYPLLSTMYNRLYKRNLKDDIRAALTGGDFGDLSDIIA